MGMRLWLLAFGLGLGLVASIPSQAADKAGADKIAKLVEQLGSTQFSEREKATKELEALGDQALEALKAAAKGDDLETKRRAEELIKKIDTKSFTKKILEPTKIRLTFKDTPLRDAIAEVTQKTGLNLILNDPENKLGDRKVTVDTGETTLWEAVDMFVQKAGLSEKVNPAEVIGPGGIRPVPPIRIQPQPLPPQQLPPQQLQLNVLPGAIQVEGVVQVQGGAAPAQQAQPAQAQPAAPAQLPLAKPGRPPFLGFLPNTLSLSDGQADPLPTCYAGAVRIRALPVGTPIPGFAPREGEITVPLQVTTEPKLQFQSLINVRIDKAVDDQGQDLLQSMTDAGGNPNDVPAVNVAKAAFVVRQPQPAPGAAPVPVRFKKGDKPSKTIKEMSGVVSIQVRTAAEALMTVEKLMDANGKEVKGESGGRLKVVDVQDRQGDDAEGGVRAVAGRAERRRFRHRPGPDSDHAGAAPRPACASAAAEQQPDSGPDPAGAAAAGPGARDPGPGQWLQRPDGRGREGQCAADDADVRPGDGQERRRHRVAVHLHDSGAKGPGGAGQAGLQRHQAGHG